MKAKEFQKTVKYIIENDTEGRRIAIYSPSQRRRTAIELSESEAKAFIDELIHQTQEWKHR